MKAIVINGKVQNYDNGRKKIEVKKEIKLIFDLLNRNRSFYSMEHYTDLSKTIERLKEIYEDYGSAPILLHFQNNLKEGQNGKA